MQLTFDSSEPLDRVLEVVGTLYGVKVAAEQAEPAAALNVPTARSRASQAPGRRAAGKTAASRRGTSRPPRSPQKLDQQAIRAWGRENGHPVRDRGRLPAALVAAYQAAAS